jgi:hypothetical protein
VGPRLRAAAVIGSNEWRAHVDQTVSSGALIGASLGDGKGDLSAVSRDTSEELTKIRTKEKYLGHQFSGNIPYLARYMPKRS